MQLAEYEAELQEINANNEKLQRTYSELSEFTLVLEKVSLDILPSHHFLIVITCLLTEKTVVGILSTSDCSFSNFIIEYSVGI